MISYSQYKPSELLKDYIDCFWVLRSSQSEFKPLERLVPDGKIEIIFNFKNPYSKSTQEAKDVKEIVALPQIIGQRQELYFIQQQGDIHLLGVRFKSTGLFPFINIPLQEFTGLLFELQDVFGNQVSQLEEKIRNAESFREQKYILETFFISKYIQPQFGYTRLIDYLSHPGQPSGNSIDDMAYHFNSTYKNLERDFHKYVGLTPKMFFKISRFNHAIKSFYNDQNSKSLTEIGLDNGYYDQSHFIRDFKFFTGLPPHKFFKENNLISEMITRS